MTIAIMQPYIFPYIGYFQMVHAVDKFIFYDDVNFIKQGWINRNNILVSAKSSMFTVPLSKATSFSMIKDTLINESLYEKWRSKFLVTLSQNYKDAPFFTSTYDLVSQILNKKHITISELSIDSIKSISSHLGFTTQFIISSQAYHNKSLERQERLLDICYQEKAVNYINSIGGQELYKKEDFKKRGVSLKFIKSLSLEYKQFKNDYVPYLSIIDILMFNSLDEIKSLLNKYELI